MRRIRVNLAVVLAVGAMVFVAPASALDDGPGITIFAAASLSNVLQELGDGFTRQTSIPVRFSFAASSALAKQIENGAPADVFISADVEWMNYVQERNLIQVPSRQDAIGNNLVLIAPLASKLQLRISRNFPLAASLGKERLAMGDPGSVPAGRYGKQALIHLGVWEAVSDHIVATDNVRSALAFVDRGETPLGIVYGTDALIDRNVRLVDVFPDDSHAPIIYPLALTKTAKSQAREFVGYFRGPAGDSALTRYGFKPLH